MESVSESRKKKKREVKELENMLSGHNVVGLLDMYKMPGRQLQKIRDKLRKEAVIKMGKKRMIKMAVNNLGKEDLKKLYEKDVKEPALILSNENPFSLFKKLKENRSPAPAKAGDIAPNDIFIRAGPTSQTPGPAISIFQKVGLKTGVKDGKIHISSDKKVVKAGEEITKEATEVFNLLRMEPMEIGLDLVAAYEKGVIYNKDVLDIDADEYMRRIENCLTKSINFSLNLNYPTHSTINLMLRKAFSEARSLCIDANIVGKDFINDILSKSIAQAKAVENELTAEGRQ